MGYKKPPSMWRKVVILLKAPFFLIKTAYLLLTVPIQFNPLTGKPLSDTKLACFSKEYSVLSMKRSCHK
jgi:hypothetical protein